MKKKYKVLIIIASVIVFLVVAGVIAFSVIRGGLDALKAIKVEDVDLSKISDGTYTGNYSAFPVTVKVSVTVSSHAITDITLLEHVNGKGQAAEVIPQMVVDAQSLNVDTVSGATTSSKVILLAIEDALSKGK